MDLNDYFDPVSLVRSDQNILLPKKEFGRNIYVHTENNRIGDLEGYKIALLGVPEERNSSNTGCGSAPDNIRQYLYKLYRPAKNLKIIDLGNMKTGPSASDSYFGLRDVMTELLSKEIVPVIIGGSQDITYGVLLAYEKMKRPVNYVSLDPRLDIRSGGKEINSLNYLQHIISNKTKFLLNYTNIGHQAYFTDPDDLELIKDLYYEAIRLGDARSDIKEMEPVFRDADLVSFDISSVRQSDSPGHIHPSPNGFTGEEICQAAWYAGLSDSLSSFVISEINPRYDNNGQSSHLSAQILWYFIEGFSNKKSERPADNSDFTKYIVDLDSLDQELVFYKSKNSARWWIEVPRVKKKAKGPYIISCSYDDYLNAGRQEIPDRWWKCFQRIN